MQYQRLLGTLAFCLLLGSASQAQDYKKASPDADKTNQSSQQDNNGGSSQDDNGGQNDPNKTNLDPKRCKMNRVDFEQMKKKVSKPTMQMDKLDAAKAAIKDKCTTASQIAETCKLFSSAMIARDFAIYAYDRCEDPENYELVENSFDSEMIKRDIRALADKNSNGDDNFGNNGNFGNDDNFGNNNNGGNGNLDAKRCKMNRVDFAQMQKNVNKPTMQMDKLEAAKKAIKDKCTSCSQIAEICKAFSTNTMAFEFVQYARERCEDPENYELIENSFDSEVLKREIRQLFEQ